MMLFKEVVGQDEIKDRLRREADEGRVAHALLFYGPEGCGKLPVAWPLPVICCAASLMTVNLVTRATVAG